MAILNSCCCFGLRQSVTFLGVLSLLGGLGWAGKSVWDLFLVINGDLTSGYLLPENIPITTEEGDKIRMKEEEKNKNKVLEKFLNSPKKEGKFKGK